MPDTEIIIVAPDSANPDDTVPVEVKITNISSETISALPGFCSVNGVDLFRLPIEQLFKTLGPGQSASWHDSFTMPASGVTVHVESWWENAAVLHKDNQAEKYIELGEAPPPLTGAISKKELEYDESQVDIPVLSVPQGQRGLVHIWGRNDTSETQRMGIDWFVADPDGLVVETYSAWEAWPYTGPGVEKEFIGGRFDLSKVGKYTIWVDLLMNPDTPETVDTYIGELCTVAALVEEFAGAISRKELEYDGARRDIPVR